MSTYVPIQAVTLTVDTATVTFSGVPQTFTDLILVINGFLSADDNVYLQFNSDTGSNYSSTFLFGSGSATSSGRTSNQTTMQLGGIYTTANGNAIYSIQNYSNTTTNKTVLARAGHASSGTQIRSGLWRSTSAISTILVGGLSGINLKSGTTLTLYGIGSGAPKAFGGSEVRTDGTYWYHTFRSSGQFTPTQALTADYLVVAGGGGGGAVGANLGGGGGGGGLRSTVTATGGGGSLESALSLVAGTNYTITVGAGGAAGTSGNPGTNGDNSVFSTIISNGGGGGGSSINGTPITTANGKNGGSGGGAALYVGSGWQLGTAGTGTANQGYSGGAANVALNAGGGGGGAGEIGNTDGTSQGGDGVAVSITGSSVTYAGGGGGGNQSGGSAGTGGLGGGGNGGNVDSSPGTAGTANTGGGGGGPRGGTSASGAGGSGIVIVRYAV